MRLTIKDLRNIVKECITETLADQQQVLDYSPTNSDDYSEHDNRQERINNLVFDLVKRGVTYEEIKKSIEFLKKNTDYKSSINTVKDTICTW